MQKDSGEIVIIGNIVGNIAGKEHFYLALNSQLPFNGVNDNYVALKKAKLKKKPTPEEYLSRISQFRPV
jgi:hypothetical protein